MACNSMYQRAQKVELTLFTPTYFDLVIADEGWKRNYHVLSNLQKGKKKKIFEYNVTFFTEVIIYQHFLQRT